MILLLRGMNFSDEENDIRCRRGSGDIFYSNTEEAVWDFMYTYT